MEDSGSNDLFWWLLIYFMSSFKTKELIVMDDCARVFLECFLPIDLKRQFYSVLKESVNRWVCRMSIGFIRCQSVWFRSTMHLIWMSFSQWLRMSVTADYLEVFMVTLMLRTLQLQIRLDVNVCSLRVNLMLVLFLQFLILKT